MSKTYNNSIINKLISKSCDGRLTLEGGVPVSTTDQTAKTTVYFTPYNGNSIGLYDGNEWDLFTFSELSLSLSGLAANTNFDIFIYNNNGILTLESTAWTNDTTRATALTTQDRIYVKSASITRRYLGTIRTTGTIGQCEDSSSRRFVWNAYNQELRSLVAANTVNHTYSTALTWRAWNNNTTLGQARVDFVLGSYSLYTANLVGQGYSNSHIGIGIDSTTSSSNYIFINTSASAIRAGTGYSDYLNNGYHFMNGVEYINAGTGTFTTLQMNIYISN